MAVLCGMPTIQYSALRSPLSVHKLFTSCIRRCLVSRACDWVISALSAVLLIFSFPVSNSGLLFFYVGPPDRTASYWFNQYRTWDVSENLGRYLSCMWRKVQGNDFELILTVKIETRHAVEGYCDSEFRAICDHCGIIAAWNCKT